MSRAAALFISITRLEAIKCAMLRGAFDHWNSYASSRSICMLYAQTTTSG